MIQQEHTQKVVERVAYTAPLPDTSNAVAVLEDGVASISAAGGELRVTKDSIPVIIALLATLSASQVPTPKEGPEADSGEPTQELSLEEAP